MKIGSYTFTWAPTQFTIPKQDKYCASVLTYSNVGYFSWGMSIIGKKITLEWEWMPVEQFHRIQSELEDDTQKVWDLESWDRIFYTGAVNAPFVVGAIITDSVTGATATISAVDTPNNNLRLTGITGVFGEGNGFTDDSIPQKSGTISAVEIMPDYNVEVLVLNGEYFEDLNERLVYRKNVKLDLLIMSEV